MKKILLGMGLAFIGFGTSTVYGQNTSGEVATTETQSIKPADGIPYSFPSEEAKNRAVPQQIADLQKLISECTDPVLIKTYQEMIWRYENAVIAPVTGTITNTK